ncbi:MAG: S49 family peptidase [Bacteroidota bacterium]
MPDTRLKIPPQLSNLFVDRLFMTEEALIAAITEMHYADPAAFFGDDSPTYADISAKLAARITSEEISLTTNFTETDIPDNSIAFHHIKGTIRAEYTWWGFSTMQFIDDIHAADKNPQIIAHLLHINSGGGEAWYLEKALKAIKELQKPVVTFIEKCCCSAAYYIGCGADRIFSTSINDMVGSIGTMVSFLDLVPYFEALGAKWIEEYADQSTLKNKDFNNLLDGKPKKYKEKWLNPLAGQFIQAVRGARSALAALPEKHDVFAGEAYSSEEGGPIGLIDEIADLEVALQYTLSQGQQWKSKVEKQTQMQTYLQ